MILLILFLLFTPIASADVQTEKYIVEKPDGSVALIAYVAGSMPLEDILKANGFAGYPIAKISDSDTPKEDQKYWRFNHLRIGPKILVDDAQKQDDVDAENEKISEQDTILEKLKISRSDFKKLQGIKNV